MLDASDHFMDKIRDFVKIHIKIVQEFKWPPENYDCIFGCWVLCYLNESDSKKMLASICKSLKKNGRLILIETVLSDKDK